MPTLIDAHEDIAYNHINYKRDYRRSVHETRTIEKGSYIIGETDETMLGWEEYQNGQVALIFGTIYIIPGNHCPSDTVIAVYKSPDDVRRLYQQEIDYYRTLDQSSENQFCLVKTSTEINQVLKTWNDLPAFYPDVVHPVGILMSIEGLEGIKHIKEIETYWEMGVRAIGPVWAGGRFCGGTQEFGGFTAEGYELLKLMSRIGYLLDLSHMTDLSARQALDSYEGPVIGSHANPRALLDEESGERHFTDPVIEGLIERDSVMGIVPFNRFLVPGWNKEIDGKNVSMEHVIRHIDYVCQLAGNATHVAIGSDFDGGFGYQSVPQGFDSIADLQKLAPLLKNRGYTDSDIEGIFWKNWHRILEKSLPL